LDILLDSFWDVTKTLPLLIAVYALLVYMERRFTHTPALLSRAAQFGPIVGAVAGTLPQCGFSAAAAALYSAGCLAPATLVAVFLSTSDEAVPVMLAGGAGLPQIAQLLLAKFTLAVIGGYVLQFTFFRPHPSLAGQPLAGQPLPSQPLSSQPPLYSSLSCSSVQSAQPREPADCACHKPFSCACGASHDHAATPLLAVLRKTLQTALLLFVVMLALNGGMHWIGEAQLESLLLTDTLAQPLLCALLGLIPSCAISVLLPELFLAGTISFGALVAGLSTGAGFGYIILFSDKAGKGRAWPVILATLLFAIVGGTLLQVLVG